ncbi:hypothetical protein [uncultured Microbulbifer sp.]|uniref:hypothetical protein n=1 Tax=uncultured Microbulbifer sp. TaxID=348147 RepID=UPI002621CF4B|nr:hypothetical protein [uncultured Microbulbifer sp.]
MCALTMVIFSGCSTTAEVQVYTQYLSVDDKADLARRFSDVNFEVNFNDTPIPAGIRHTTLIYSPHIPDIEAITSLVELLETTKHGVPRLALTGTENHYYSRDILGLYLVPEAKGINTQVQVSEALAVEYNGRCESVDVSLSLNKNGTLLMVSDLWDEEQDIGYSESRSGVWVFSDRQISITLEGDSPVEFDVARFEKKSGPQGNTLAVIELNRSGSAPFYDGCDFVYQAMVY